MNAPDPVDPNGPENDPTRGLAQRTATTITRLWAQDGPPLTGPVRMWEPERVLEVCAQVHQSWAHRPRGRFATASVHRLLGTVIGYGRLLHPPMGWVLVSGGSTTAPQSAPVLVWKHETTHALVVDVLRTPVQCVPLLDAAAQAALDAWSAVPGLAATRVVDLHAPRRTRTTMTRQAASSVELTTELFWDAVSPATGSAAPKTAVVA